MTKIKPFLLVTVTACLPLMACGKADQTPPAVIEADAIFQGMIYTGDDAMPVAKTVTSKMGEITGVFAEEIEVNAADPRLIEFGSAIGYPGFTDGHAHLMGIGFREMSLNLEGVTSVEELKEKVAAAAAQTPAGEVVYGRGWIETGWPEGRFPNRYDLDEVAPDHPVILTRADGHAMVVNSIALAQAGITNDTQDMRGGAIERDDQGVATGILIDAAQGLAYALMAEPTEEKRIEALEKGANVYAAYGWTGIHSMSVDPRSPELMMQLEEQGKLPIRVYNSVDPEGLDALIESGIWEANNGKVVTRAMKGRGAQALGSRGAALHEPYSDRPETDGLLMISEEEAKALYRKALKNNIQVNTHAIGDRGNTLVLDWYEEVLKNYEGEDPRWRIEHSQILRPVDIPRFKELGVIPSMQPSHAIGDLHFAPDRLGKDRLNGAYAWRSLTDAGALIVGGSDAPVERGDPMIEFYAAVGRMDLNGFSNEDWHAEEALTREEALDIFTINPAIASFNEWRLGTIEVGKRTDMTVLSDDIMTIPVAEIPKVTATMTIVDGQVVYKAD